ncbi:4-aminobutyrate--2-oxoglutarate transaminase [Pseudoruegeria sp. SK021]|uniref:4-aminobutyrate--2-oxoglutarate transaminase n=1 Tax=Pseudoruegeria sp. SK021 TaxID=1933035 RepID=UPI000A2278AE|nr:4-aminobutyrate--2-oxoglutarate transaminase [Pseudoruegeria sp. SK021]OSP54776.1 4-aminobutyrate--2-oxoglutarate transaminase [Pseudoruegeria sp. SK021]
MTRSTELEARRQAAVARGVAGKPLYAERALNAELWDVDGTRFIDFAAGIAVTNTGHCHPKVMQAVADQAAAFTHTCFHVAPFEGYVRLCERLNAMVDTGAANKSLCLTTGVEAVENAIKIARAATGRPGVIAFGGAFHGRTAMGMALTGKVMPYKKTFGPLPSGIYHAPFPNAYLGVSTDEALRGLDTILTSDIAPDEVAAFIVEPVQGEGGFNVAPPEFLAALRARADAHGIILILDEVQGGMARTGRMLSCEHAGVKPDIVTLAKGLGGGFPISAVVGRAELIDAPHSGGLGGTYAGNPLAVAAAHAVLDVIADDDLCARAEVVGTRLRDTLTKAATKVSAIGDIRGLGAMVAFELVDDGDPARPAPDLCNRIIAEAQSRGLILLSCGTRANVVRLLPALTIEDAVLDEGAAILYAAIVAAAGSA